MSSYSAADSALGYLYQCVFALKYLIEKGRTQGLGQVRIECEDDVEFEAGGDVRELLQLKHKAESARLTNRSKDLWGTLRIWSEYAAKGDDRLDSTHFFLLTTAGRAGEDQATRFLGESQRSVTRALTILRTECAAILAGEDSDASDHEKALRKCARAFDALTQAKQRSLLSRVTVLTAQPRIEEMEGAVRLLLRASAVAVENQDALFNAVTGWWYRRCVKILGKKADTREITLGELESQMADLAQQFAGRVLSRYAEIGEPTSTEAQSYEDRTFVEQVRLIELGEQQVSVAKAFFYKADAHRKRWTRELVLDGDDLAAFDDELCLLWQDVQSRKAAESLESVAHGKEVYADSMTQQCPQLRGFSSPFLLKGSLHVLADKPRIGWHPDWETLLNGGSEDEQ